MLRGARNCVFSSGVSVMVTLKMTLQGLHLVTSHLFCAGSYFGHCVFAGGRR